MKKLLVGFVMLAGILRASAAVINVSPEADLQAAVIGAKEGDTIVLGKGEYEVAAPNSGDSAAIIVEKGVSIIGETGDPADVIVRNTAGDVKKTDGANTKGFYRVFLIKNASAVLSGIAVEGGMAGGGGGDKKGANVRIASAGGTVTNCIIRNAIMNALGPGDYPKSGAGGAGISCESANGLVTHCVITNNFSTRGYAGSDKSMSGAFANGGAVLVSAGGIIRDSLIACNWTRSDYCGSAVAITGSGTLMENCTVAENWSEGDAGNFCPVQVAPASTGAAQSPIIRNTLIYGNVGPSGCTKLFSDAWVEKYAAELGKGYVRFVNCATDSVLPTGLTMINEGIVVKDFRPTGSSSTVNAGAEMQSPVELDLAGVQRVIDGIIDIGCYEYDSSASVAVEDPVFTPVSGTKFYPTLSVTLTCATAGAKIRYTIDGADPTEESLEYVEPIVLSETTTIKARGFAEGQEPSDIVTATYTYEEPLPPAFGTVTVTPRPTRAAISGEIASVGNNGATACDVYLSLDGGEAVKIVSGAVDAFDYVINKLVEDTSYSYVLTISNNAATVLGAETSGSFTTTAESEPLHPSGDDDTQLIQSAVDNALEDDVIVLGAGTYSVSTAISVTKAITIIGETGDPADVIVRNTAGNLKKTDKGNNDGVHRVFIIDNAKAVISGIAIENGKIGGSDEKGGNVVINSNGGTVTNCIIRNAIVVASSPGTYPKSSGGGAAIACLSKDGLITHCVITNNFMSRCYTDPTVVKFGQWGGSVVHVQGGGVIRESLIAGNSTANDAIGSIVFLGNPGTLMENCTVANNYSEDDSGNFYPIMFFPAGENVGADQNPLIQNTLFYGNVGVNGSRDLFAAPWIENYTGQGMAKAFTRFVNCATDATLPEGLTMINEGIVLKDFRPTGSSSTVDKGAEMKSPVELDLAGTQRVIDGIIDIGCYEYDSSAAVPVEDPVFDPVSGTKFYPTLSVTLTCATAGAKIHYTIDGADPTEESPEYAEPIVLSGTTTIKACGFAAGQKPSDIVAATYTYEKPEPPALGAVKVTPRPTKATISGEIASVGNNGATACDVYLALNGGEAMRIATGETAAFKYVIPGLAAETAYSYELSISNNALTVMGASTSGGFTTKAAADEFDYCVSPTGSDQADGTTRGTSFASISNAVANAEDGQLICVLKGTYEIDTAISVTKAVMIMGETGKPADVIVRNTAGWVTKTSAGNNDSAHRVFVINNAAAVLSGIAIENGKAGGSDNHKGGNVLIDANGGTVTNCIIRNAIMVTIAPGDAPKTSGGGAAIASLSAQGLITHCVITNNFMTRGGSVNFGQWGGAVVHVQGGGVIRESLIAGNSTANDSFGSIVFLGNASTLMENCTIAGNRAEDDNGNFYPIMFFPANTGAAQNPLIRNTLVYGNVGVNGSKDLFAEPWLTNYASYLANAYVRFVSCATDANLPEGLTMINEGIVVKNGFRPTASSSTVDQGAEMISPVDLDLRGKKRVCGRAVDIGCYEYVPSGFLLMLK